MIATVDPEKYYDELGEDEWERSGKYLAHSVEHENTYPYLEKHLPDEGHVLDAGGASGRYTVWLAENGYKVTLVDISEEQLRIAKEKLEERDLSDQVEIKKGDIRDLEFEDETFDAVLCLGGPLSHVTDENEREKAANELLRVAKTDYPVFVSVIGFFGALLGQVVNQWGLIKHIEDFYENQKIDGGSDGFAESYFFKPNQLKELLERNGLDVERLVGLDNVLSVLEGREEEMNIDEEYEEKLRETARLVREEEAAPHLSAHILAYGWKK